MLAQQTQHSTAALELALLLPASACTICKFSESPNIRNYGRLITSLLRKLIPRSFNGYPVPGPSHDNYKRGGNDTLPCSTKKFHIINPFCYQRQAYASSDSHLKPRGLEAMSLSLYRLVIRGGIRGHHSFIIGMPPSRRPRTQNKISEEILYCQIHITWR